MPWPRIEPIVTARCSLEPLSPAHAPVMVDVLADARLYEFIGGEPPSLKQLQRQYAAQSVGTSADQQQWWCNWIITMLGEHRPVGYVQATVEEGDGLLQADLAWVVQPGDQGRGLATEAARAMVDWLGQRGVTRYSAYIHPEHAASAHVATRLGMHQTSVVEDGEFLWEHDSSRLNQGAPTASR